MKISLVILGLVTGFALGKLDSKYGAEFGYKLGVYMRGLIKGKSDE